jgi:hypothetical protein
MSVDGTYKVTVKTPMGVDTNEMTLKTEGTVLSGTSITKHGVETISGIANGDSAEWEAKVKSPMGLLQVTINITVSGDKLIGKVKTPVGQMVMEGDRI